MKEARLLLALAALIAASPVCAQDPMEGEIVGSVVDVAGNPMPDQRLELQGPGTGSGLRLVAMSDARGEFAFRRLAPGTYQVAWVVNGTAILSRGSLVVAAGATPTRLVLVRPMDVPARPQPSPVPTHTQAITLNPLFGVAGLFNAEYERRLGARTTWGVSGTYSKWEGSRYRTAKGLVRVYTRGHPLRGVFLGLRFGASSVSDWLNDTGAYGVVGGEVGQTFGLAGRNRELIGSVGVGVNRLIGGPDTMDPLRTFPAIRLNIGVAF